MTLKNFLVVLFVLLSLSSSAQKKRDRFSHQIARVKGDLNKDSLPDLVVVKQDTVSDSRPYRLQIFFAQADGTNKLIVSTEKAIPPQFSGSGTGNAFDKITVEKNVLTIENELLRGWFRHIFRYQNGNFELIGFSRLESDGHGKIHEIDFNLSTGVRFYKISSYENDKVLSNEKQKKLIRPLPKLQDFIPFEKDDY